MTSNKILDPKTRLAYERERHALIVRIGWAAAVWVAMLPVSIAWLTFILMMVVPVALFFHALMAAMVRWSRRRWVLTIVSAIAVLHSLGAALFCTALLKEVTKPLGFYEHARERAMIWLLLAVALTAIVVELRLASSAQDLPTAAASNGGD